MGHAQGIGAGSEAVLHHDAVATDDVAGSHLLGDGRLAGHVGHFNDDVLGTEVDFLVELDAEVALEHGVREDVPVAVLQIEQISHGAVVRSELTRAVLVAGFHVVVGTIFLAVCLWRGKLGHFTKDHHFGFEAAAWYWHFVDVVWLFLFAAIYIWGS